MTLWTVSCGSPKRRSDRPRGGQKVGQLDVQTNCNDGFRISQNVPSGARFAVSSQPGRVSCRRVASRPYDCSSVPCQGILGLHCVPMPSLGDQGLGPRRRHGPYGPLVPGPLGPCPGHWPSAPKQGSKWKPIMFFSLIPGLWARGATCCNSFCILGI